MIVLILFSFLAGIVTILSPCILPILPVVLTSTIGGQDIGKARPLGVVFGFIASFTFFTLFLSIIVNASGIPADTLRLFSVVVIGLFGVSYLIPTFQRVLERSFSFLAKFAPQNAQRQGFFGGVLIGLSIGLLWTPCVGPILASVISLAITGQVTLDAFLLTFAYATGTAIPLFIILLGGQTVLKKVPWLLANTAKIQKIFGLIMILTAVAIFFNLDRKFQSYILATFPQYGVGLTQLEDNGTVREELQKLNKQDTSVNQPLTTNENLNTELQPKGTKAPEIRAGGEWLNTKPLSLAQLQGKVVLIDFWTYTCINCQRTLPYLTRWYADYKDKGLVIIGVHSPEFAFEKEKANVEKALKDFGISYPVVQDNDFTTWKAYSNQYWPAKYLIDKDGFIRYYHFGEGEYDTTERAIQTLLKEAGNKDITTLINNPESGNYGRTPETYLGSSRMERMYASPVVLSGTETDYKEDEKVPDNGFALNGKWLVTQESASPRKGASLVFNFEAKEVYLVMKPKKKNIPAKVKVFVDDKQQFYGVDNKAGVVTVDTDKMYKLIMLEAPQRHLLKLEFEDDNAQLFAFTFG